ncbi:MAG TPA: hypothetical protein VOA41_01870 [Candidatus Dormibacteraeota bacterium]|nr:hypothetical protein [Candidatus Dormibacteraeota bacterium]
MCKRSRLLPVFILLSISARCWPAEQLTSLGNHGVRVEINRATGAITTVTNLLTSESYRTKASVFEIQTSAGAVTPNQLQRVFPIEDGLEFDYAFIRGRVTVRYHAPTGQDFIEKTIAITNDSNEPITIYTVIPERIEFQPSFENIHPHYDPSQYRWLINLFLRGQKGGFYSGIENPVYEYWTKGSTESASWLQLHFEANVVLPPRETYTSEPSFLGAFRKEKVYLFKELRKLKEAVSAPKAIPSAINFDQEILDWGEVWGMQDFIRAIEPPHESERPGFYVRAVGEVGGRKTGNPEEDKNVNGFTAFGPANVAGSKRLLDEVAALGHVPHLEWSTEWFGNAGYGRPSDRFELENAGPGDPIPVNPYWLEVVRYGWQKGIKAGIFETIPRDFARNRTEWKVLNSDGTPWTWSNGANTVDSPVNCWGNSDYANWRLEVTDRAIKDYKLYMVAWDSFVPAEWAWLGFPVMKTACYAHNHSHPPGDIRYAIFRNVVAFTAELQRRNPRVALRVASGLTTDYPWVLKNSIEYHPDIYDGETGASYWTSYNFRFLPMYKSGVQLTAPSRAAFEYLLLRSIAYSDHFMFWHDTVPIALADRDFWDRWLTWADNNIEYLRVGRTLFREPWGDNLVSSLPPNLEGALPYPNATINGTAHCVKDRGYLFLFNPSLGSRIASIPINHWLGLTQGENFGIRVLNVPTPQAYGPYARGQELRIEVPAGTAMVLQIEPTNSGPGYRKPRVSPVAPVDKAFFHWNDIPWKEIEATP